MGTFTLFHVTSPSVLVVLYLYLQRLLRSLQNRQVNCVAVLLRVNALTVGYFLLQHNIPVERLAF